MVALAISAFLLVLVLLPRPLWLDEILQLLALRMTWAEKIRWMAILPGSVPLPFLVQQGVAALLKDPNISSRVVAWACASAALFIFGAWRVLDERIGVLALVSLAFNPLFFRYALEGRSYSAGLLFGIALTAIVERWNNRPTARLLAGYGLTLLFGLYFHPYVGFIAASHVVWLLVVSRKRLWPFISSPILACAGFLPWLLFQAQAQATYGTFSEYRADHLSKLYFFSWAQLRPDIILREWSGGGYLLTILLLAGSFMAIRSTVSRRTQVLLLACQAAVCFIGPIALDAGRGYFFAARQLMFGLPSLVALSSIGWMELAGSSRVRRVVGFGALALILILSVVKDYKWFNHRPEDWAAAAREISALSDRYAACVIFAPYNGVEYYALFQPEIRGKMCSSSSVAGNKMLVSNHYGPTVASAADSVRPLDKRSVGGTEIVIFFPP